MFQQLRQGDRHEPVSWARMLAVMREYCERYTPAPEAAVRPRAGPPPKAPRRPHAYNAGAAAGRAAAAAASRRAASAARRALCRRPTRRAWRPTCACSRA